MAQKRPRSPDDKLNEDFHNVQSSSVPSLYQALASPSSRKRAREQFEPAIGAARPGSEVLASRAQLGSSPQQPARSALSQRIHPAHPGTPAIATRLSERKRSVGLRLKAETSLPDLRSRWYPPTLNSDQPPFAEFCQAIDYLDKMKDGTLLKSRTYDDMVEWISTWVEPLFSSHIFPEPFVGALFYGSPDGSPDYMGNLKIGILSEVTGTVLHSEDDWSLRVIDAMLYLEMAKIDFEKQPETYKQFLSPFKDIDLHSFDIPAFLKNVSILFEGHPSLILGIKRFVPPELKGERTTECNSTGADASAPTNKGA